MTVIAIDWANDEENLAVYDGKKITRKMPKPIKGLVILVENLPIKQARAYLEAESTILRCNTNETAKERRRLECAKTHDNDVKIIYNLYKQRPETFREFRIDPVLMQFRAMYSTFKEIQGLRIATSNREYANNDPKTQEILEDLEGLEGYILKGLKLSLEEMPVYRRFLSGVKGIGPATAAGLLAFVGDFSRFSSVSHMMAYFGLDVRDGKAPRKTKGQIANWHQEGRSLILGVIADLFVKMRTPIYRDIYEKEKAKQLPLTDKPIIAEKRARRKMAKEFIKDFYREYKNAIKSPDETSTKSATKKKLKPRRRKLVIA